MFTLNPCEPRPKKCTQSVVFHLKIFFLYFESIGNLFFSLLSPCVQFGKYERNMFEKKNWREKYLWGLRKQGKAQLRELVGTHINHADLTKLFLFGKSDFNFWIFSSQTFLFVFCFKIKFEILSQIWKLPFLLQHLHLQICNDFKRKLIYKIYLKCIQFHLNSF